MERTIDVPCWPVVRIWMEHHYGNPVKMNFSDVECKIIGLLLQSKKNAHHADYACRHTVYGDSFKLVITKSMRVKVGYQLSATRALDINGIIKNKFYDWIFTRLDAELRVDEDYNIKAGIIAFCQELDENLLDDHVPYDTVKRAYSRYRKANGLPIKQNWSRKPCKNIHKMSPSEAA